MKNEPLKVLLLEDDLADARLLRLMLEQVALNEFEVTSAGRLGEALTVLAGAPFDVVLTDLDVPDSRGLGTFLQIIAQVPDVPIIVLTGLADESAGVVAVQKGAQDYLIKGQANAQTVARSLRHAFERHKREMRRGRRKKSSTGGWWRSWGPRVGSGRRRPR